MTHTRTTGGRKTATDGKCATAPPLTRTASTEMTIQWPGMRARGQPCRYNDRSVQRFPLYHSIPHDVAMSWQVCNRSLLRASQKSEVKQRSPSCKLKGIEKHLHSGETHDGLYYTVSQEPIRPKPARRADAIALPGVPTGGGWSKGAMETLCILLRRNRSLYLLVIIPSSCSCNTNASL